MSIVILKRIGQFETKYANNKQQRNGTAKVPLDKYRESVAHKTLENWQETGQDDCIYTLDNEMHLLTNVAFIQDFH